MNRARIATFGAVAASLVLLAIVAPEAYTGTFSDAGSALRVAMVVGALVVWGIAVSRLIANDHAKTLLVGGPILVVLWLVLWPYVRPTTEVDEAFPDVGAASESSSTPTTTAPTTTTAEPAPAEDPAEWTPDTDALSEDATTTTAAPTTAPPTTAASTTTTTTVSAEPVELLRGSFQGLTGHRGNGEVALYRLVDQTLLLRFEDVDIGSGPDLEVYLVPGADQRGHGGGVHVASLTAERGNQNYTPPGGVDLEDGTWTVLVWCETFAVEVANATLG